MNSAGMAGRTILVVEDQPLIAMEIVQAFQELGAAVTTTTTLKQALILVEHDGLAAAILDHVLGDGDSARLCQRLKERGIPFVIYTGLDHVNGVCAHGPVISKPASMDVLVAAVERAVRPKPDLKSEGGEAPARGTLGSGSTRAS
jgi:DNA-binding response OmpR family regulator